MTNYNIYEDSNKKFGDIYAGTVFLYNNILFLKTIIIKGENCILSNAVLLEEGIFTFFQEGTEVLVVKNVDIKL